MLWALAILGLLPAAFTFGGDGAADESDSDADSDNAGDGGAPQVETSEVMGDLLDDDMLLDEPEGSNGADYEAYADGGETTFYDFTPNEDHVSLHLTDDGSGTFIVDALDGEGDAPSSVSLSYFDGDSETTLNFDGLETLPVDDISIGIISPETSSETLYPLEEFGDFDALLPNDPDISDAPAGDDDEGGEALQANDPDASDSHAGGGEAGLAAILPNAPDALQSHVVTHTLAEGGETLVLHDDPFEGGAEATLTIIGDGAAISTYETLHIVKGSASADTIATGDDPVSVAAGDGNDTVYVGEGTAIIEAGAGDDVIYGGDDADSAYMYDGGDGDDLIAGGNANELIIGGVGADTLSGGSGNDTLVMDIDDAASGGEGHDTFGLGVDANRGEGVAQISDFEKGGDILHLTLMQHPASASVPDVRVSATDDGTSGQVVVNGKVVALLKGMPDISFDDLVIAYAS